MSQQLTEYSGLSLSSHSQWRPPYLTWPQIFVAATIECIYFSFSANATSLMWLQFLSK